MVKEVTDGIFVPASFCKLDVKNMSKFEARINRFLLWNLLGPVDLPTMLGRNFGNCAKFYNDITETVLAGPKITMDDMVDNIQNDDERLSVCSFLQIAGYANMLGKHNILNYDFLEYFKSNNVDIDKTVEWSK